MFDLKDFPLPYKTDALAPYISARTLRFHHDRHLGTYIKNLSGLIKGTDYENLILTEIIKKSAAAGERGRKIFNNAAQVFNHEFFFNSMKKNGARKMPDQIAQAFGGPDQFKAEFKRAAAELFGSGWVWLVEYKGDYKIAMFDNADTPVAHGMRPLLTLDVWEHAYYLDYQNRRADFADAFLNHLIDWNFVTERMKI